MTRLHTGIEVDLRRGVKYALARRAKLLVYLLAAAAFLVNNGVASGQVAEYINLGIALVGALGVHQVTPTPALPVVRKPRKG